MHNTSAKSRGIVISGEDTNYLRSVSGTPSIRANAYWSKKLKDAMPAQNTATIRTTCCDSGAAPGQIIRTITGTTQASALMPAAMRVLRMVRRFLLTGWWVFVAKGATAFVVFFTTRSPVLAILRGSMTSI